MKWHKDFELWSVFLLQRLPMYPAVSAQMLPMVTWVGNLWLRKSLSCCSLEGSKWGYQGTASYTTSGNNRDMICQKRKWFYWRKRKSATIITGACLIRCFSSVSSEVCRVRQMMRWERRHLGSGSVWIIATWLTLTAWVSSGAAPSPSQSSPDEVSSVDPLYSAFSDNVPKMKVLLNKHLGRLSAFIWDTPSSLVILGTSTELSWVKWL